MDPVRSSRIRSFYLGFKLNALGWASNGMDQQMWNKFAAEHGPRSGAFLQSWEWGEFQKSVGREVRRYDSDGVVAQIISHQLPFGLKGWNLYRGPVGIRNQESGIMDEIVVDIKKTNGVFLHIEPNQELQATSYKLQAVPSRQPRHTFIGDLRKHDELLLSEMHEKTRYNIRLAEKQGVTIKQNAQLDDFLKLLKETTERDGFSSHPESYYRKMVEEIPNAKIFIAYHEQTPLAAALVIFFGNTATYLHGASSNEKRNLMAPHLLHWKIVQNAREKGCTFYDFWGIAPEGEQDHAWAGITRFKKGFGGEIVSMPAAVELPLRKNLYRMYTLVKNLRP